MIRPVATLPPEQRRSLAPLPEPVSSPRRPRWFVAVELALLLAVPLLGYFGVTALLSSTAGTFRSQPLPGEPGWRVLVDPSPVTAVAETIDGRITGVTLITRPGPEIDGGALMLIPGSVILDNGRPLAELPPEAALTQLSQDLRLGFTDTIVLDAATWTQVLGDGEWDLDNPDPIPAIGGVAELGVGRVTIDATSAPIFLGTVLPEAGPLPLLFRRRLFWMALLEDPPQSAHPLAEKLRAVAAGSSRIENAPLEQPSPADPADLQLGAEETEQLLNQIVPLPQGSEPGDRIVIRIVDRTGRADTQAVALLLGSRGFEVSEIANADPFADGPTQLVVPSPVDIETMRDLAAGLGADTVSPDPVAETDDTTVVLLVGSDLVVTG